MSKKNILLLHVFVWLFAAFVNLRDLTTLAEPEPRTMYLVSTLFLAIPFYLFYSLLVPRYLENKRYGLFFTTAIISILLLPFAGYTALFAVRSAFEHDFSRFYGFYTLRMHLSGMSVIAIAAAFGTLFRVIVNWMNTLNQKEILEKEKAVAELALLKSKVNPHFLFNTLNNIDVLITEDPERASQALLKLSAIMRYLTYETATDFVPLTREIEYISDTAALYALRISDPALIRLDLPDRLPDLPVAPMLFLPFLENAFKYATMKGPHAGVTILFRAEGNRVFFACTNPYETAGRQPAAKFSGTGIANARRRLEHIYPGRHELTIRDQDGQFRVELTIITDGTAMPRH